MKIKIESPSGQKLEADIEYGKFTDVLSIDVPLFGLFTINGDSARDIQSSLNQLMPIKDKK